VVKIGERISLDVAGIGIIFYSPSVMVKVGAGADYFSAQYGTEEQVQAHVQKGDLVGFATDNPGRYILNFLDGYPTVEAELSAQYKLRLGLRCVGGVVYFRDLEVLSSWSSDCPPEHQLQLPDGIYHVTLCSDCPESGALGDNQVIDFYLNKLNRFPRLAKEGIPALFLEQPP
jgi:hypothetical protein